MKKQPFYKIRADILGKTGLNEAFLYAVLENASRVWQKDENGYFSIWSKQLVEETHWSKNRVIRVRQGLIALGLLDYIPGKNQNMSGKYKLL